MRFNSLKGVLCVRVKYEDVVNNIVHCVKKVAAVLYYTTLLAVV